MLKNSSTGICVQIFLLLVWISPAVFGLQCHTCMFVDGVIGDLKCKDALHLATTKDTYRPCNEDGDALNGKELQVTRAMTPDLQIRLGCLKTLIKTEGLDILIRGCYGREIGIRSSNSRYSSNSDSNNVCESPRPSFWTSLRDGPLKNATKPVDITNAKLEVCVCSDMDGCNGGISSRSLGGGVLGVTVLSLMLSRILE